VFGPFGRPAHVAGSPAPAVGAVHQMLPIGKMLPIGQMLLIGKMLPIGQMLSIGQMLLIGRMLLILPAPAVGVAPHDRGTGEPGSHDVCKLMSGALGGEGAEGLGRFEVLRKKKHSVLPSCVGDRCDFARRAFGTGSANLHLHYLKELARLESA
jgi:hypothetical protein